MQLKQINKQIFWLDFPTQKEVCKTFIRFQEHYEGPVHRGTYFSLKAYKAWYRTQSKSGKFTYFSDWSGFNIPSSMLKPFYAGHFNPLTNEEKLLLELFEGRKDAFYLLGTFDGQSSALGHEICHGLFSTNIEYQGKVLDILAQYDTGPLRDYLIKMGYHEVVLDDECHAYAGFDAEWLKGKDATLANEPLGNELRALLEDYMPKDYLYLLPWLKD